MGVILTMTMVMITGLAITRERERGTMENLLSMPTRPSEVLIGKIVPYILVGYIQVSVILIAAHFLFHVPMQGSILLLLVGRARLHRGEPGDGHHVFHHREKSIASGADGFLRSFSRRFCSPDFMFPFRGMPRWAQMVGEVFPLTHFLRIVRGILLKGNSVIDVSLQLWQIALFALIVLAIGIKRYRQTLD